MSSYSKRISSHRSDDTMDDDGSEDKDDTKRKSRNLSEKKRRDQFNMLVNELSSMVATGGRKMDKSTVLRSTISFLKSHNELAVRSRAHEIQENWKPAFLSNEEFTHLILEALDGFIAVFAASGQIYYVSESITALLGHLPNDLLSMTIYDLVYEDDQTGLYNVLLGPGGHDGQLSFSCHFRRGGVNHSSTPIHNQQSQCYELVHFVGYLRNDVDLLDIDNSRFSGYSGEADTRLFVGTGRLQTPQLIREMSIVDSAKSEFTSRHSLEWKFLFLDHRAPPIIGYLPFEVLGTSGYDYYHVDDLDKVVSCHEALMKKGEGTSCFYRFLTKGQQWIWLQTRFYITYHQWNSKPEFIVCTHRVISYIDVMKQIRKEVGGEILAETNPTTGSGTASPWASKSSKTSCLHTGSPSDCTSMSADSPVSRQSSLLTQQSTMTRLSQNSTQPVQTQQQSTFVEPQQYVAAIPMQPVITSFPSGVRSPLPPVDNLVISSLPNNHLQVQLQRKHAELQAMIGQQQAELRRVSEQLLMARLGLLPATQSGSTVVNVTVPYVSNSGVSSTTMSMSGANTIPVVLSSSVPVPSSGSDMLVSQNLNESAAMPLSQQQAQMLFASNTNSQHK